MNRLSSFGRSSSESSRLGKVLIGLAVCVLAGTSALAGRSGMWADRAPTKMIEGRSGMWADSAPTKMIEGHGQMKIIRKHKSR